MSEVHYRVENIINISIILYHDCIIPYTDIVTGLSNYIYNVYNKYNDRCYLQLIAFNTDVQHCKHSSSRVLMIYI